MRPLVCQIVHCIDYTFSAQFPTQTNEYTRGLLGFPIKLACQMENDKWRQSSSENVCINSLV